MTTVDRNKKSAAGYLPALDGLRCFAVLPVLAFHSQMPLFRGGFLGVDIFFVLSGYLITTILLREFDQFGRLDLRKFLLRRVLRLVPALLLLTLLYLAAALFIDPAKPFLTHALDALMAVGYVSNWTLAAGLRRPVWLEHTWSLAIEAQFYLLWPLVVLILLKIFKNRLLAGLTVFILSTYSWLLRVELASQGYELLRLSRGLDTRADALLIGCSLALILSASAFRRIKTLSLTGPLSILSLLACLFLLLFAAERDPVTINYLYWLVPSFAALIILDCVIGEDSLTQKILSTKAFVYVGKISYGLYLWHFPIMLYLLKSGYTWDTILAVGTVATFIIASLSYHYLELPFLNLKKKFSSAATYPEHP